MKILLYLILFITVVISIFLLPKALRVHKVKTLYDKDKIVYNFVNMDKIFPSRNVESSENPKPIKRNIKSLPETFIFEGEEKNLEEYLDVDRVGRGRPLQQQQRRHAWEIFEVFKNVLDKTNATTFTQRLVKAYQNVVKKYDYVFIDEAQDLKPIAIRFCLGLCHNPKNIFLTADGNQSIYGKAK